MNKYVIFDRDGTLIEHVHYLKDPKLVKLKFGVEEALTFLKNKGFNFGIISNQSLINREIGTKQDVEAVNLRLIELCSYFQISFDFIYYCPHTPDEFCNCRKPQTALGIKAISKFKISISNSYYIGDKHTDVIFASRLNLQPILISDNPNDINNGGVFEFNNLIDAAKFIIASS